MRPSILVLLFLALSARAHAQITAPALFVEGAVFGDHDASRSGTPPPMTAGVAGTIGFRLSRGFSASFEVEAPSDHRVPTYTSYFPGRYRDEETSSVGTITYGAMFAWHAQPGSKVDLALMAGFGEAVSKTNTGGFSDTLAENDSVVRHEDLTRHDSYQTGSVSLGTDVAVRLTRHMAVVPELRLHVFSLYGCVVRPKIALRWTF